MSKQSNSTGALLKTDNTNEKYSFVTGKFLKSHEKKKFFWDNQASERNTY